MYVDYPQSSARATLLPPQMFLSPSLVLLRPARCWFSGTVTWAPLIGPQPRLELGRGGERRARNTPLK